MLVRTASERRMSGCPAWEGGWFTYAEARQTAEHNPRGRPAESHTRPLAKDDRRRQARSRTPAGRLGEPPSEPGPDAQTSQGTSPVRIRV